MSIIENELTKYISEIAVLKDNRILVGHENGRISLWVYKRPKQLEYIRFYENNGLAIIKIVPYLIDTFISINKKSEIKIWEIESGICKTTLEGRFLFSVEAVVLPSNLLVVLGYSSIAWSCFDVFDMESGKCIYKDNDYNHRPHLLHLKTTAQGFLLVADYYSFSVWKVTRKECTLINQIETSSIYSMAVLPTGEIVTANHELNFYKITLHGEIYHCKTLTFCNVIDIIYPVGGFKLLIVDRSGACSGTIKLWNHISDERKTLGNSRFPGETSRYHNILEKKGAILSLLTNRIVIHEFSEDIFYFPSQLAEVRKNARALSQAQRTATSLFQKMPMEVNIRIILSTCESKDEYENAVCEDIIQNYFCRPMICEE